MLYTYACLLCTAFLAIVFIQSGLDKIFGYKGNLEWLKGHFAKSPLNGTVPLLLPVLTLLETASGLLCLAGTGYFFADHTKGIILAAYGIGGCGLALLALLFGQRVAKDYAGAASLVPYFLVVVVAMITAGMSLRELGQVIIG